MAIKFLDEMIVTTQGLDKLGLITSIPSGNVYNTTWAQFVTNYGYNGGIFNIKGNWDNTPWGETRTYYKTLRNGNYAKMIINKQGPSSGGNYDVEFSVELFDRNNVSTGIFINMITSTPGSTKERYFDGALVLIGYDDSTNRLVTFRFTKTTTTNTVYTDRNDLAISLSVYIGWLLGSIATDDPYSTMPDNENPGSGYGPFDYTSEDDLPPALPSASAAQCGFVSLWNPTITELQGLASYLWTSGLFDVNTWRHLFSNPMDCILSVGIIPFVPDREENKEEIIFCGTSHSNISSYRVPTQMYVIPMGTMHITGMSQGYTDYEPYAKASIFLPYCGTYALSCDEIVDADISLEYHVDIYTGACVAYLTIERTNSNGENVHAVMYQFTGNMLSTIPVTGADHSNFIQSLLFMGAAIGATVATAGALAPEIGGAMAAGDAVSLGAANMATAGSAINTVMSMKPNVMRSGNLSSTAGLLGKQAPTITITWSNICRPEDEYKLAGMPIHKSGTLSDFEGFTVVSAVHMDNITCTDEERTMIEEQLYKGVII